MLSCVEHDKRFITSGPGMNCIISGNLKELILIPMNLEGVICICFNIATPINQLFIIWDK